MDAFLSCRLTVERGLRHGTVLTSADIRLVHLTKWMVRGVCCLVMMCSV
jgi:hypothetical protein